MMTTNQKRIETKMDAIQEKKDAIQEKKDANLREIIVEMKDRRNERTAGQEAMDVNHENMEPNPGEKEAATERQENPNEEVAFHSLRTCQTRGRPAKKRRRPIQRRLTQLIT
jgi:hypothetical protein